MTKTDRCEGCLAYPTSSVWIGGRLYCPECAAKLYEAATGEEAEAVPCDDRPRE